MPEIETASGSRSSFPASWGEPPGTQFSDERSAWVLRNIANAPVARRSTRNPHEALRQVEALKKARPGQTMDSHLALRIADSYARNSTRALQRAMHLALRP